MRSLRIGMAQINPTIGALDANVRLIAHAVHDAQVEGVQLLVVPELAVSGYPPEDLLLRDDFLAACAGAVRRLAQTVGAVIVCVGAPSRSESGEVHNSLFVLQHGQARCVYDKVHLPNYGVFDERRYFTPGPGGAVIRVGDDLVGLTVCEDVWLEGDPLRAEAAGGAALIVNASASPYHRGKATERERLIRRRCEHEGVVLAYCNLVGGQDELVFDGGSFICDAEGRLLARSSQFESELVVCDVPLGPPDPHPWAARVETLARSGIPVLAEVTPSAVDGPPALPRTHALLGDEEEVYSALVLGTRDYVVKCGFHDVLLGVSGGIDSALVTVIACDALGPENVTCVVMPSGYSSAETQGDARALAARLGTHMIELPIDAAIGVYRHVLERELGYGNLGVAEENLQARIRGNLLMALSNSRGGLVLSTGNKSELSVGYSTLYGDMAGGYAVIKDVPKTLVFTLARWLNSTRGDVIPASIIDRPPSAELAARQRDTDTLPPYDVLDPILQRYIEHDEGVSQIITAGFDPDVVRWVVALVDRAEYKRRQAPPGVRITPRALGRDRRLPIAAARSF
jgi:NAD+ synthase (glutamine-hydrolysing)